MTKSSQTPYLSIIIPVYNEHNRVIRVKKIGQYLKKQKYAFEIIIVNDGSDDDTLKIISKLSRFITIKVISYDKNRGKGYAIKTGMLEAKGKYLLFMDVDLSTPIEEFEKFLPYLKLYPVIIATRKRKDSTLIKHQPIVRELLGKAFTKLSKLILGVQVSDFTCGFKCFQHKAAKDIFSRSTINRWSFDSEILYIAKSLNLKILEIPVTWKNDSSTKVKFPHDLVKSLTDILRIKLNSHRGVYTL